MKKMFSQGLALAVLVGLTNCAYAAPATYNLDEMVVTASRMELNLKELPQSAEIITKDEIKAIGATNIREALRLSPSMVVTESAANGPVVKLRGSSDYLILVNGHRYTERIGRMDDHRMESFNMQNVERIEVLRGPAGALYGSSAQAGVINIVTKAPAEEGAVVGVTTGKREMSNYYHFDTGRIGKLAASFDANFTKIRPFKWDDAGKSVASGPKQNFSMNVDYEMDENNKLSLFAEYENSDLTYTMNSKVTDNDSDKKNFTLTYDGKSYKSNYSVDMSYSFLNSEHKFYDIDARNTVNSTENFSLTYGGEYSKDKNFMILKQELEVVGMKPVTKPDGTQGYMPIFSSKTVEEGNKTTDQWAGYVYGDYKASEKLHIIPSVRYDHHDSFGSHTSPNLGLTYSLDDSSRIKANYGTAYRAPSTEELYEDKYGMGGMFLIKHNPDLKPEKTKGFELSYEKEFGDKTTSKVAYFKNTKEDALLFDYRYAMSPDPVTNERYARTINVEEAEYEGVEFALDHNLGNGFTLGFNYEYLDAQKTKAGVGMNDMMSGSNGRIGRLEYTARNTYTVKLQWVEPEEQEWSVTAWNQWLSDYWTTNNVTDKLENHSINTFNIAVNKSWEDNKYNAFVGVDNVFDKKDDSMRYSGIVWRCGAEVRF